MLLIRAEQNRRVLKNTLVLYGRQILLLLIHLYTLRLVLTALGVEDFGVYTVVAGVVALASFLPSAMSSASQRYFAFALGQRDHAALRRIFSVNLVIYLGISVIALALLESAGRWFVHEHLHLPPEKLAVAQVLYQISIFTFIASLLAAPFMAIIIAHEEMDLYAYVSLYEAGAKLAAAVVITQAPGEKLTTYGLALLLAAATTTGLYYLLCRRRYPACTFQRAALDRRTLVDLLSFTGWTLFGHLTTVARHQAVTILLNQAFNPTVAAARAIALTVAGQVTIFATNFNTSLYPPLIKTYAANAKAEMFHLLHWGSKLTFFLMWVFALPLYVEMDTILRLWLGDPPAAASTFAQLAVIEAVIQALALPLATAARAPGRMRGYELSLGSLQLGILIVSWLLLEWGYPAVSVFYVAIVANGLMFIVRLVLVSALTGLVVSSYLTQVLWPVLVVASASVVPVILMKSLLPATLYTSAGLVIVSLGATTVLMFYLGFDAPTRQRIRALITARLSRRGGS